MMDRNPISQEVFKAIEGKDLKTLKECLEDNSKKKELYDAYYEAYEDDPIKHAVDSSFWEGVVLIANHDTYNTKNANAYKDALKNAVKNNQIEAIKALLQANTPFVYFKNGTWLSYSIESNIDQNNSSETVFWYAIKQCQNATIAKTLFAYLPKEAKSQELLSKIANAACTSNKLDIAEMIFKEPNYILEADVYLAYINKVIDKIPNSAQLEVAKDLTQRMQSRERVNPLKTLVTNWYLLKNNKEIMRYLFDQGFNLTQYDDAKETPIETAVKLQRRDCAKLLIEIDKEKNKTFDPKRIEALHYDQALLLAIKNNETEIAKSLLDHHAKFDMNTIGQALENNNVGIIALLLEYDVNPLIRKKNGDRVFYGSSEIINRLQRIDTFITSHLPNKKESELKLTSAEQSYQYAFSLNAALIEDSVEFKLFKDKQRDAIEYLGISYLNLFSAYIKRLEHLTRNPTWIDTKSGIDYQKTITQTNRLDTITSCGQLFGDLSLLRTVLNKLIAQLDPKINLTYREDEAIKRENEAIKRDFNELPINWQNLPDVELMMKRIDEYLFQVKPATQSYILKVRNYLKDLGENINKQKWEYKNWNGKVIEKQPAHIENIILPMLRKLNNSVSDAEVLNIFINVQKTFTKITTEINNDRQESTKRFARNELNLIEQIPYQKETNQINHSRFLQQVNPTNNYLPTSFKPQVVYVPPGVNSSLYPVYNPLYTQGSTPISETNLTYQQQGTQESIPQQMPVQYVPIIPIATTQPMFSPYYNDGTQQQIVEQQDPTQVPQQLYYYVVPVQQPAAPYLYSCQSNYQIPMQPYVLPNNISQPTQSQRELQDQKNQNILQTEDFPTYQKSKQGRTSPLAMHSFLNETSDSSQKSVNTQTNSSNSAESLTPVYTVKK